MTDQLELFPAATSDEINLTKQILSKYKRKKSICMELEKIGIAQLAGKQKQIYSSYIKETSNIERAIRIIEDDEIRKALELRYIQGVKRKLVVVHFRPIEPSTVDRRINRGIESVANSMKLFNS